MKLVGSRICVLAGAATATTGLVAIAMFTAGAAGAKSQGSSGPTVVQAKDFAVSPPVRDLPPAGPAATATVLPRVNPLAGRPGRGEVGTRPRGARAGDPLAGTGAAPGHTPAPSLVFNGTANPFACGGCSPPDTNGDVSPDNYVQIVNATKVAIFDKSGTAVQAPFDLGDLWNGGPCRQEDGDPVALYDGMAKRWVLTQLAFSTGRNALCIAVSKTSDPTGSYFTYRFDTPDLPDYFKLGVWPTGYYATTNESTYAAYALDRTKMLAGDPSATAIRFDGETNFLMPASVDGAGSPGNNGGLFYTFKDDSFHGGTDRIELFRLTPDFATPANSTFRKVDKLPIAPYTYTVCGFFNFDCIPQGGTPQKVDAVSEWPMFRFPYRRLGGHQALVGNFTVGGGGGGAGAAIRWFELRKGGGNGHWRLFQEGTLDSPKVDQWMGSINIDQSGDIALGYSESSKTDFPSIRYATRKPSDPLGTLEPEKVMQAGGGSQTASDRWGDYSGMAVDPKNGCDFWYTTEYYRHDSGSNWKTAVGKFTVPGCGS